MRQPPTVFRLSALAWAGLLACLTWSAPQAAHAQLTLLREPANARVTEPAPNIILSLDDSGSMGWDLEGCATPDWRVDVYGEFNEAGAVNCPGRNNNTRPSRMRILRDALIDTFGNTSTGNKGIIEDNRVRLAWQSMWDNARTSRPAGLQNMQDSIVAGQPNAIRPFSGTHRQNFHSFVTTLSPVFGTPSHKMMSNVNAYMSTGLSVNSPFATLPGVTGAPFRECRRTYHIFMTDGAWNSEVGAIGNADGTARTLPDGTAYSLTSDQTRIYRDEWGGTIGTLADWALANWATDFQTSIPNEIKPLVKQSTPETIGSTTLQPYWNPKNNPMTWQGVTQYTIGFGKSATQWIGRPTWGGDTHSGADYGNLINGGRLNMPGSGTSGLIWGDVFSGGERARPMDLWHMALNGRGKYYQARSASDLRVAFTDILSTILLDTNTPIAGGTSTSLKLGLGGQAFLSGFDGAQWNGLLNAVTVTSTGSIGAVQWNAAATLDARNLGSNPRNVLTHNGTNAVGFSWTNISAEQRTALRGGDSEALAQERLTYLLGERSREQPAGPHRERKSRLGSLVNSSPVFMGPPTLAAVTDSERRAFINNPNHRNRTPVVFVGSNGGMLHAFNASASAQGAELFAYVPRGAYSKLRDYTLPAYQHQYIVDGTPMVADAKLGDSWRSVLVGTLGLGGRGYFALDVTNPSAVTASSVLFDLSTPGTSGAESHIGHIATPPAADDTDSNRTSQVAKLNNGRWAVVLGNGVNSPSGRAVLLIQYLDGDRELLPVLTNADTAGNGLSTPRLVDLDSNGTADLVYAGDIKGNLWSFDLGSANAGDWKARFGAQPLLRTTNASGVAQPITTAPYVMRVPRSQQMQVAVGTGRLMATDDAGNSAAQSLYSVRDPLRYTRSAQGVITLDTAAGHTVATRNDLVLQTSGAFSGSFASTSANPVNYSGPNSRRGWLLDLPQSGERQLANTEAFDGSVVRFRTTVPPAQQSGESCNLPSTRGNFYSTFLDIFNGAPPITPLFTGQTNTSLSRVNTQGPVSLTIDTTDGEVEIICNTPECAQKPPTPNPTSEEYDGRTGKRGPQATIIDWRRLQ
jgi:type IV pilus assembly protein PilY1